ARACRASRTSERQHDQAATRDATADAGDDLAGGRVRRAREVDGGAGRGDREATEREHEAGRTMVMLRVIELVFERLRRRRLDDDGLRMLVGELVGNLR